MKTEVFDACDQVFFAGLSGLYQGILITILVGLGLRLLTRTNAATRHAIWLVTLLLVVSLIPAHCLRNYLAKRSSAPEGSPPAPIAGPAAISLSVSGRPAATESSVAERLSMTELESSGSQEVPRLAQSDPKSQLLAGTSTAVLSPVEDELLPAGQSAELAQLHTTTGTVPTASMGASEDKPRWQASLLQPICWGVTPNPKIPRFTSLALLAGMLVVGVLRAGFLLRRLFEIRQLKAKATPGATIINDLFERLRRQLSIQRDIELKVSALHGSPVLLGFVHPVVLIPAEQPVEAEQLEPILRHELAHVQRRDDWVNLAQQFLQAILFFHPGIWWIGRQLSIEREIACDDHVLQQGPRARAYALLLADFASRFKTCRPLLAPGVSTSKSQLQKRIDMILNKKRNSSPRLAKTRLGIITSAAALAAALAIYAAPRLVLAQSPAAPPSADASPSAPDADLVPPVPVTSAPVAVISDTPVVEAPDAAPPTPPAIPRGPKMKPGPFILTPPSADRDSYVVAVPRVAETPRPPKPPDVADPNASLEERLRRLEKMVESLVKKQERKEPRADVFLWKGPPGELSWVNPDKFKDTQERAQREAARAADQAKRATSEAEKAMKLQQDHGQLKNKFGKQIEALEKQRAGLEREMEKMQQQIELLEQEREKLEQDQEQFKEDQHSRSELREESGNKALAEQPDTKPANPSLPKL